MNIEKLFEKFPIIDCGQYILREITESDTEDIYEMYSDYENVIYDRKKPFIELEEASDYIKRVKDNYFSKSSIRWGLAIKASNKVIGIIAINLIDARNQRCSIGYILNKKYWRRGIMSSCIQRLFDFIFDEVGVHRISAEINPSNVPSLNLVKGLGFNKEGVLRGYSYNVHADKFEDRVVYSLLNNTKD